MTVTLFSRSLHNKDSKSEPCVHSISWINRWNLTRLAQIHNWNWGKKWLDFILFPRSHRQFNTQILIEKSLCAHYTLNQWLELYQTSTDTSLGYGKEVIRFWWPWPHFQCHYIIKTKNEPCMHTISWINRWNLTKVAQILHWDGGKKWLDFSDLDLIF